MWPLHVGVISNPWPGLWMAWLQVLEELSITLDANCALELWPIAAAFRGLTRLQLHGLRQDFYGSKPELMHCIFHGSYPRLASLSLDGVRAVRIAADGQLPQLTELEVGWAASLELAAALPALRRLHTRRVKKLRLDAALPVLTSLQLACADPDCQDDLTDDEDGEQLVLGGTVCVRWAGMPALADLRCYAVQELAGPGGLEALSALRAMSSLKWAEGSEATDAEVARLLAAPPPQLCRLVLGGENTIARLEAAAIGITQLTCLVPDWLG